MIHLCMPFVFLKQQKCHFLNLSKSYYSIWFFLGSRFLFRFLKKLRNLYIRGGFFILMNWVIFFTTNLDHKTCFSKIQKFNTFFSVFVFFCFGVVETLISLRLPPFIVRLAPQISNAEKINGLFLAVDYYFFSDGQMCCTEVSDEDLLVPNWTFCGLKS